MLKYTINFIAVFSLILFFLPGCSEDNPVESEEIHFEAIGLYVISSGDTIVKYIGGQVIGEIEVQEGTLTPLLSIRFLNEDGDVGIPTGDEYALIWELADEAIANVDSHDDELSEYKFHIEGKQAGATTITVILNHNDHKDFESKEITIRVTPAG
jgi:hypothetical protein